MKYILVKKSNNYIDTIWIFIIVLFIIIALISIFRKKESFNNSYNLGVCSKNCCATQWKTPINVTEKSNVDIKDIGTKYYTSNLTCNNGKIDTGCVCLNQNSMNMLSNRGNIDNIPSGNGLLNSDNTISAFKIMDDNMNININNDNDISTETEKLLKYQIGQRDKDITVNRK